MSQLNTGEKLLRLFTEIKPGEGRTAWLMFTNVFLILMAYYFVKPIREGWIAISEVQGLSSVEVKAYSSFLQSIALLFIVGFYARLSDRWLKSELFTRTTLFCISNMLIFWLIQPNFFIEHLPYSGLAYYLWVGIFGVFVVAQFWTFCADLYADDDGKRLLPFIALGATSGAALGALSVELLIEHKIVPTEWLLLVATIPLFLSIALMRCIDLNRTTASKKKPEKHAGLLAGVKLISANKLLLLAAIATLLTSWVNTNGENLLFSVVEDYLSQQAQSLGVASGSDTQHFVRDGTTSFYGSFYFWVNICATVLQAFVASRLLKFGGFAAVLLLMPVVSLISYSVIAFIPALLMVKIMKVADDACDYSINNTARQVLWLPISSSTKFHCKPAIDTLYVRLGDGLAALTVALGIHWLALPWSKLMYFNIALTVAWLLISLLLLRAYKDALTIFEQRGSSI
ncbi:NTP/NDP exchange transporter [Agaribacterium haliotis]|uniref:NTP/NDP exchange transporter n=1 Tax=Agaribacterium haliotis TaxID=2013869 RepID=UPI000BB55343|nr:hypothetical protein [Agaribacterium haliotis]